MEITPEIIAELSSENVTKKRYDAILHAITEKTNEIWRFICEASDRHLDWWAFQNDVSYGHGSSGGYFDPENDAEFIDIVGENEWCDLKGYEYNEGFPTSFLCSDYKSIVLHPHPIS